MRAPRVRLLADSSPATITVAVPVAARQAVALAVRATPAWSALGRRSRSGRSVSTTTTSTRSSDDEVRALLANALD